MHGTVLGGWGDDVGQGTHLLKRANALGRRNLDEDGVRCTAPAATSRCFVSAGASSSPSSLSGLRGAPLLISDGIPDAPGGFAAGVGSTAPYSR